MLTGLFAAESHQLAAASKIKANYPMLKIKAQSLAEQNWESTWMADFHPMQFGKRLWVIPSHHANRLEPFQVRLDPGLAFGTGKHPTTALCLQWLDEHINGGELLIDFGCGSGILGIAALKLGAKKVYAIDHDPQALQATRLNAEKNHLTQIITMQPENLSSIKADIVIANILANPLIELSDYLGSLLTLGGKIILSGVLVSQVEKVIAAYTNKIDIIAVTHLEEWARIDGIKKA